MQALQAQEHYPVSTDDVPWMPGLRLFGADYYQPHGDMPGKRELALSDAQKQQALLSPDSVRGKLYELQSVVATMEEVECPLLHQFAPGVYMRTIFIPAGTVIVGKIHKHSHPNILSQGRAALVTEGGGIEVLTGPVTIISPPGTKRGLLAYTDLIWTTIHLTNSTDLAVIEDEVIAKTYEDYEMFLKGGAV